MRIAIISDVHSNFEALRALPADFDEMWVLGDLVNYGPEPREVVELVRARASVTVRGNHDHSVGYDEDPRCTPRYHDMAHATRRFSASVVTEDQKGFLRGLPLKTEIKRGNTRFFLTHARPAGPSYRRRMMKEAQEIAKRYVLPWLKPEQEEAERQYRRVSHRFVEVGNDFLKKLADAGIPELARMPHALDPETGFRVRSRFTFLDFIEVAQPASPLRWMADVFLGFSGARGVIENDAREFLAKLLEVNSTRVQSDILNRIQESRGYLEVEIRKLLHEVSRVAEHALSNARRVREEGISAVEAAKERLGRLEHEFLNIRDVASLPFPMRLPLRKGARSPVPRECAAGAEEILPE